MGRSDGGSWAGEVVWTMGWYPRTEWFEWSGVACLDARVDRSEDDSEAGNIFNRSS